MLTPLLRGIVLFILSNIFILAMFSIMSQYTFIPVLEKENVKAFVNENVFNKTYIGQFCERSCLSMPQIYDICIDRCTNATAQSASFLMGKIDDLYTQKIIMGSSLDELIALQRSWFMPSVIIAIISAALMLVISKKPFRTLGTNLLVLGISSLILYFALKKIIENMVPVSTNELASALIGYIQSGFTGFYNFGLLFLAGGIALYIVHFALQRAKKMQDKGMKPVQVAG